MSVLSLNLPTQIPWRRLAASRDMMDTTLNDRRFPLKWKSSLSMFYFHPEVDATLYPGRRLVYLKVVCSITGFQVDDEELGVRVDAPEQWDSDVWRNFNTLIRDYYPCYGALLQLAVFPGGDARTELADYPCIVDFEPKKREMFELVTQTGEVMTGSASAIRVGKNNTTVDGVETVDVARGWQHGHSAQAQGPAGGGGGSMQFQDSYERGFRANSRGEDVRVRTIEDSREKRESLSHTTQLTQMYHLLDSYHLGTNRALFVIFPRPHIVDVDLSVTNGLRRLEGIQEFFLVVECPESLDELCVEVQLETSHLHTTTREETTGTTRYETGEISQRILDNQHNINTRQYRVSVPAGFRVDRSRGSGGYDETLLTGTRPDGNAHNHPSNSHNVYVRDDHLLVEVHYAPGPTFLGTSHAYFTADYTVYYIAEDASETARTQEVEEVDLFMTGRHLCACLERQAEGESSTWRVTECAQHPTPSSPFVSFEEPLPERWWRGLLPGPLVEPHPGGRTRLINTLAAELKDRTVGSLRSSRRYAAGTHGFLETDFAARRLMKSVRGKAFAKQALEGRVTVTPELRAVLSRQAAAALSKLSLAELLTARSADMAHSLGVSTRLLSGLKLANIDVPRRSKSPPQGQRPTVPSVEGLSIETAISQLAAAGMVVGDVGYRESEGASNHVLHQSPSAGTVGKRGLEVDLVLSSGAIIELPSVIDRKLDDAVRLLRRAGIGGDPQVVQAPSERSLGVVLEMNPPAGTKVTPTGRVTLRVSGGPQQK